jgi:hypothetical protein
MIETFHDGDLVLHMSIGNYEINLRKQYALAFIKTSQAIFKFLWRQLPNCPCQYVYTTYFTKPFGRDTIYSAERT